LTTGRSEGGEYVLILRINFIKTTKTIKMKKLLFIGLVALSSCKKEEFCNCGTITNDNVNSTPNGLVYTLSIKNSCSGNTQTFIFDQQTWFDNQVGDDFCVYNVDSW
jgi:hypothetical protein